MSFESGSVFMNVVSTSNYLVSITGRGPLAGARSPSPTAKVHLRKEGVTGGTVRCPLPALTTTASEVEAQGVGWAGGNGRKEGIAGEVSQEGCECVGFAVQDSLWAARALPPLHPSQLPPPRPLVLNPVLSRER